MTEYKNQVEYQRKKLFAEEWGTKVKYLLAQDGYMEVAYNNGQVTREYSDDRFEVKQEANSIEWVMLHCPYEEPKFVS